MTSRPARQVKKILWREVRSFWRRARDRGYDLGPEPALDLETGVQWTTDGSSSELHRPRPREGRQRGTSGRSYSFSSTRRAASPREIFLKRSAATARGWCGRWGKSCRRT